jgi:transposase
VKIPPRCPRANAICERVIGTPDASCQTRILILGDGHLTLVLREYLFHYDRQRPAAVACHLSPAVQLQVATALDMLAGLGARLDVLRHRLLAAARCLTRARVLASRLYGVGPVTGLAMICWLGGAGRFSSSRKAVRSAGLDVTVWSSDRKGPPGRLSRQGPEVLRWAVYEAGKTHARASAPCHR